MDLGLQISSFTFYPPPFTQNHPSIYNPDPYIRCKHSFSLSNFRKLISVYSNFVYKFFLDCWNTFYLVEPILDELWFHNVSKINLEGERG